MHWFSKPCFPISIPLMWHQKHNIASKISIGCLHKFYLNNLAHINKCRIVTPSISLFLKVVTIFLTISKVSAKDVRMRSTLHHLATGPRVIVNLSYVRKQCIVHDKGYIVSYPFPYMRASCKQRGVKSKYE